MIGASILTAWPANDTARVVAFFLVSGGYVTAVTWTWANEVIKPVLSYVCARVWLIDQINKGNAEERALTISSMNGIFYATSKPSRIVLDKPAYPQTLSFLY